MSKFSEYLKLIPAGFKNLDKVLEGVVNQVKLRHNMLPEDEQEEIIRRRMICSTCPFMSKNAVALGVYTTNRLDEHCMHCGCPLDTRTASLDSPCGIEAYNKRNLNTPLELKWDVYKTNHDGKTEEDRSSSTALNSN